GPVTLSLQSNNASLSGQVSVNAVQGVATFTNLSIQGANQTGMTLTATAGTGPTPFEDAVSQPFDLTSGTIVFVTQPPGTGQLFPSGSVASDQAFQVQVQAVQPDGVTVDSNFAGPITLTLTGLGTFNGTLTQNAVSGVATFPNLSISGGAANGLT